MRCTFEYAPEWLAHGFSISPLQLPLRADLFIAEPTPFYGNFGIFEDSLPDGYGRFLLNRMFRRMVFNVLIGNKDDHAKNFSFVHLDDGWHLAPAYNLIRCVQGYNDEHATSVMGHGNPSETDIIAAAEGIRILPTRAREIICELRTMIEGSGGAT